MLITHVEPEDRAGFLDLVNAEIRPDRAKTHAVDDFPVILGPQNSPWQLIYKTQEGRIAGCIAALIRSVKTSSGELPVAGVGSVVTHPDFRGQGISRRLQNALLERLRGKNIPLAVLWTDQPEIYAGRGFQPAGWEIHLSLIDWQLSDLPESPLTIAEFSPDDIQEVEALFRRHPLRTIRQEGDSQAYYTMPGTRGLVAREPAGRLVSYAFCGKGGDFPAYVCEWGGSLDSLLPVLAAIRRREWAQQILIPAGAEDLVNPLVDRGCGWVAMPSGQWSILDPEGMVEFLAPGIKAPRNPSHPEEWLGSIGNDGQPLPGALNVAIWGFDSV